MNKIMTVWYNPGIRTKINVRVIVIRKTPSRKSGYVSHIPFSLVYSKPTVMNRIPANNRKKL